MNKIKEGNLEKTPSNKHEEKVVELPAADFFKINFISFLVPLYFCLALFLLFEYFFINFFTIPPFLHFLILPGFLVILYYIYLIVLIEVAALWVRRWNKKSPPQQGIFERVLDDVNSPEGKMIEYYHKRGFIIKYPMWLTSKSPFPWLVNRTLRRIGHNKIGKNVIFCDAYVGLEFTDVGDNVFIYPSSGYSSHAVNSIFGKLTILELKFGERTTLYPGDIAGPNVVTEANSVIYPNSILHKNWRGKSGKFYYRGNPARSFDVKR